MSRETQPVALRSAMPQSTLSCRLAAIAPHGQQGQTVERGHWAG